MTVSKTTSSSDKVRWRARVKSGRTVVASRTFDLKREAETWHDTQKRALDLGEWLDPKRGKETVSSAWARWQETRQNSKSQKTHDTDRAAFKRLPVSLKNRPVGSVSEGHFTALYDALLGDLARSSVLRYRNAYGAFFTWANRDGLTRKNPALAATVGTGAAARPSREIFPLTLAELRAVHAALVEEGGATAGDVALFLGLTGLRWGEVAALRVRDVQRLPRPAIRVQRSKSDGAELRHVPKGGKPRTVPLVADAWAVVEPLMDRDPEDLLFGTRSGGFRSLASWKRDVGWSQHSMGRKVHDLRHSFATNALGDGIDLKTLQTWLGHASATMTADLYSHWMGSDADAAAVARLDAAWSSKPGAARGTRLEA